MLWHYTSGDNLRKIARDRVLRPFGSPVELPAVWFTAHTDWDPGARVDPTRQAVADIPHEVLVEGCTAWLAGGGPRALVERIDQFRAPWRARDIGGFARIGVAPETATVTWREFTQLTGMPLNVVSIQEQLDRAGGAEPDEWRVSLGPVPAEKWLAVEWRSGERGNDNTWRPAGAAELDPEGRAETVR